MYRKHKIQLLGAIFVPLIIAVIALLNLFFPYQILQTTYYLYFLPLIFLVLYLCLPIGRKRIGGDDARPKYSFIHWFFFLFLIELVLGLLFYGQYRLLFPHLILTQVPTLQMDHFSHLSFNLFFNKDLFPWTLLAVVAVIMAVASFRGFAYWPMSNLLETKSKKPSFLKYAIKIIIAIYLRFTFRFFIAINLVVAALLIALLFRPSINLLQPLNSFFVGGALLLLYFRKDSQKIFVRVDEGRLAVGFFCLLFIALIAVLMIASDFIVVRWILPRAKVHNIWPVSNALRAFVSIGLSWKLWLWGYWILAIPFFASLLAKISYGRKIYLFIIAILLLPLLTWLLFYFGGLFGYAVHKPLEPWVMILVGLIGQALFFGMLIGRASVIYAWMGFVPMQLPEKVHSRGTNQLLIFAIVIVSLLLLSGIGYLQLLTMLLALPCMTIFIVNMIMLIMRAEQHK